MTMTGWFHMTHALDSLSKELMQGTKEAQAGSSTMLWDMTVFNLYYISPHAISLIQAYNVRVWNFIIQQYSYYFHALLAAVSLLDVLKILAHKKQFSCPLKDTIPLTHPFQL